MSSLRKALNIISTFIKLFNVENLKKVPKLLISFSFFYNWYFYQLLYALNDLNTLSVCSTCAVIWFKMSVYLSVFSGLHGRLHKQNLLGRSFILLLYMTCHEYQSQGLINNIKQNNRVIFNLWIYLIVKIHLLVIILNAGYIICTLIGEI